MNTLNVKTGDLVVVIAGKDKGAQGKVLKTMPEQGRVIVAGVNMISRHTKARKAQEKSSIVKKEGSIDVSNVMPVCPACGKPTRVKHAIIEGKKVRVCKCGASLDTKYVKETAKKSTKKTAEEKAAKAEAPAKKAEGAKKTAAKKVTATSANKEAGKATAVRKSSQRGV